MKITDERKNKTVKFAELDFGDVFEYEDKKYMKTHEMNGGIDVNAFNISNGDIEYFDSEDLVEILNTELVIRG